MKFKILMIGLSSLISIAAFAQKSEVSNAQSEYNKYDGLKAAKGMSAMANSSLKNAKASIDKAAANDKTAALPQTLALKAAIYSSLALQDSVQSTSSVEYSTAYDALKKSKELDTKNENKSLNDHTNLQLAQYMLNKGVTEYQNKKFDDAYKSFDNARQILPDDTTAILNTSIAAINAKNYPAAITNYNRLLGTNYSAKEHIYNELPTLYLVNKDTVGALKSINDALVKYPTNTELRRNEIIISLQSGRQNDLEGKIDAAIKNDPKNKALYYYSGLTYSTIADAANNNVDKEKDPAKKAALQKQSKENYVKAAEMYKKAVEIDPNYFEANLNLGYVMVRPAIDIYNSANKLPANRQKEYDAEIARAAVQFEAAKPYLLKAVELNPKSTDALTNLLSYYRGRKDNANAAKIKAQIDEIKAGH